MRIEFWKMQGLGNDFLVFDAPAQFAGRTVDPALLCRLADRHTGVGFDQALMLEGPRGDGSSVDYRVFNADGGEVEQCGNGARCIAALVHARRPQLGRDLTIRSPGGPMRARIEDDGRVSVEMGVPNFDPRALPMEAPREMLLYPLEAGGTEMRIGAVSMGNPHAVVQVDDVDGAPIERLGPVIECHPAFPRRVNVGFMQVHDRRRISLRVFERGVGETLACGTGACAAVAVGRKLGLLDAEVDVDLRGGRAQVAWPGGDEPSWLTGPALVVFTGTIEL
ncbi:MAG TPA: diaminopimelate epimerase [Steroidobacteraceae bacterium]|nr:diaminopimelate epimerase [Steroidobacteraceae bacterium]